MDPHLSPGSVADFLPRLVGGEMAERIRSRDWSDTPVGPMERWPSPLKSALSILLASRFPMFVWWGEERIVFYNDAYIPLIGDKHPGHLGARAYEDWAEIWEVIGALDDQVFRLERAIGSQHLLLIMHRHGYPEETYFGYSYSPITAEDGTVAGLFCACYETTIEVLRERRLKLLQGLGADPSDATVEAAAIRVMGALDQGRKDIPFALLYLVDGDGAEATLVAATGVRPGAEMSPWRLPLHEGSPSSPWPLARLGRSSPWLHRVDGLGARVARSLEPDRMEADSACILPIASSSEAPPTAFLILGISPMRAFDEEYEAFFRLVARHVGTNLAAARTREMERERLAVLRAYAERSERDRAQLEAVFQSANDGIIVMDMQGNVVLANEAEARIYGFRTLDELKQNLSDLVRIFEVRDLEDRLVPPEQWPAARLLRGEFLANLELRARRLDTGQEWVVGFSGAPIRDAEGRQTLAVLISRDITEVKRAEQALRESEALFRDMANSLPLLTWMADSRGWIFWYNQRWFEYTGTTLEEMEGWGWRAVHHPEHVERVVRKIRHSFETGEPWEDTFPLRSRTGEWRWFLARAVPLRNEEGRIVRWFGSNTDVTEELRAREELALALEARDEFLSIASHELKTPLSSLKLQAQLMKRGIARQDGRIYEPARVARLVDETDRQTERLTRLIDDMLDIARIRTGRLSIHPEPMALDELVREVVERMRPQLVAAGTHVGLECAERVEGQWDRLRIEQVLTNLLTNAQRYGEKKPVTVRLERRDSQAHLSVRDQGLGVPPESQERIFERFERGISANEVSGLGLGLFITRQIVEAHGGRIWVESEGLGDGSTFHVELPLGAGGPDGQDGAGRPG
jgi:PAS domain S-box-containing protein